MRGPAIHLTPSNRECLPNFSAGLHAKRSASSRERFAARTGAGAGKRSSYSSEFRISARNRTTKVSLKMKNTMRRFPAFAAVIALFLTAGNFAMASSKPTKDIVDIAVAAGSFKTLVAAVKAAGLVDTLKSKGPFTVFAPTDDAFAKLPAGA